MEISKSLGDLDSLNVSQAPVDFRGLLVGSGSAMFSCRVFG